MDFKLYLNVPYEKKDEAKSLGAWWDAKVKKWFIPFYKEDFKEYQPFFQWILGDSAFVVVPYENLYIMETYKACWKCRKKTKVIAFSADHYVTLELDDDEILLEDYWVDYVGRENPYLLMFPETEADIPLCIKNYVKEHYHVEDRYSKTLGKKQFANYCEHCNALQGNYHLFQEPSSPFWLSGNNEEQIRIIPIAIDETIGLRWNTFLEMYQSDYLGRFLDTGIDLGINVMHDNLYNMMMY